GSCIESGKSCTHSRSMKNGLCCPKSRCNCRQIQHRHDYLGKRKYSCRCS
uniref:Omega-segestritoxin-Sf1a n=1 Tax=Segestria florentina TaxID=31925 RepID=TX325_SEGFL|nr:RecName: Full=Omega-segestritoxin-Sf1a; Short=Omega-SGTX-Sf1a; AltName: Full=Toxin SNX-325 [Segestria florentina]AAB34809.1 SNX-325=class B neuronal-type calcium channel antagonist [Segestria florentina=spiders, venom, Peptide, 49 aa] [Segestria florentina]